MNKSNAKGIRRVYQWSALLFAFSLGAILAIRAQPLVGVESNGSTFVCTADDSGLEA